MAWEGAARERTFAAMPHNTTNGVDVHPDVAYSLSRVLMGERLRDAGASVPIPAGRPAWRLTSPIRLVRMPLRTARLR